MNLIGSFLAAVGLFKLGHENRRLGSYRGMSTLTAAGSCEGLVLEQPRGKGGFGYDPLFLVPALGKTMAEIDMVEKNRLSHRAAAFRSLAVSLQEIYRPPLSTR